jgi:hypothetical protein
MGFDNTPNEEEIANLTRTAQKMEEIRSLLHDTPIHVDSGFRSPLVNTYVGGSKNSAHLKGLACDFAVPAAASNFAVAVLIANSPIDFDQLILEYGWVHVGLADEGVTPRRELLTKKSEESPYVIGLKA